MVLRGVFVGRFQPFHLGHCHAVRFVLEEVDEITVVVGSSQHSYTPTNPFTCGERISMIKLALNEIGIDPEKYLIVPVQDTDNHALWVSLVRSMVPDFSRVYSNDALTSRLFQDAGVETRPIPLHKREIYSATDVRRLIAEGGKWQELLPYSVSEFIKTISGDERVRSLMKADKK